MSFLGCVLVNKVNIMLMERIKVSTLMQPGNMQILSASILAKTLSAPQF